MKQQYRSLYDNLTSVKREIQFCQHKVDQSRRKMMEEFDSWYKQCYLGDTEQPSENIPQVQSVINYVIVNGYFRIHLSHMNLNILLLL